MRQIEGRRAVLEALEAGQDISEIIIQAGARRVPVLERIRRSAADHGVPVRELHGRELDARAQTEAPQGVIALAPVFDYVSLDHLLRQPAGQRALFVALDGVTDPHNVGAVARSAEAAGAHGLIIPERRAAGVTPAAEKVAAGALEHLPVARVTNLSRALVTMREAGVWIVGLDADAQATVFDFNLATEHICLVIGGEGKGLSRLVADRADLVVGIPMAGRIQSLNASVAAGVALFEVLRQRSVALEDSGEGDG